MDNIVSAAAYVFARNEYNQWCILCGKRSGNDPRFQGGLFDVPVGMREMGESPADTAMRETMEETGIKLPPNKLKFIEKQPWGKNNSKMGSNFLCILDKCQPIGKGDWEHEGFIWLPIEKVDELKWAYGMNNIIKKFFMTYIRTIKQENINNNMKRKIRLTESDLHRIVKESINRVIGKYRKLDQPYENNENNLYPSIDDIYGEPTSTYNYGQQQKPRKRFELKKTLPTRPQEETSIPDEEPQKEIRSVTPRMTPNSGPFNRKTKDEITSITPRMGHRNQR